MSNDPEQIGELLKGMENNRKLIETEMATLVFYMQGGLNYDDSWLLTLQQRKIMHDVIEKHYKAMNPSTKEYM